MPPKKDKEETATKDSPKKATTKRKKTVAGKLPLHSFEIFCKTYASCNL
jgi:hypothetical protein